MPSDVTQSSPSLWSEDALLTKARVYVQRASDVETGSGLEQLFSLIGLELLARASLARVHPALLADPSDGPNLLFAFGFGEPRPPRSVPIATVFRRCRVVVPSFTEEFVKDGVALMALRNEELHSGGLVLETLRSSAWQPQYYKLCDVLLAHLGFGLADFFPPGRATAASTILSELAADVESDIKQRVADRARAFAALQNDVRALRIAKASAVSEVAGDRQLRVPCPACGSPALVGGETSGISEPRTGDGEIERDVRILPTTFRCLACELPLEGHAELFHAGLGDEYSVTDTEDPLEYYGIDPLEYLSAEDLVEPDYGND